MENTFVLPMDGLAKKIVRHFQSEGFFGISEAFVIRIRPRIDDRMLIDASFEKAAEEDASPPVGKFFEIRPYGHYSDFRDLEAAKAAISSDFTLSLRLEIPKAYYDPAPVFVHDAIASGTKYDAMVKPWDNVDGYAFALLLNDPDSAFFEYLGTRSGASWQGIIDDFERIVKAFEAEIQLD